MKDFIHRLDNFDGEQIAAIAVGEEYRLFEEAFEIYKKCNVPDKAMDVLLEKIADIERAHEFAQRVQIPAVWSKLAVAQLDSGLVSEAIASYNKAKDPSNYVTIIEAVANAECYEQLVLFLQMARESLKEPVIDSGQLPTHPHTYAATPQCRMATHPALHHSTEMIYSLAKCDRLGDLEEFVATPNVAKIQAVGDRLFDEQLFQVSPNRNALMLVLASCSSSPHARPHLKHLRIPHSRHLPGCQAIIYEHRQQRAPSVVPRALVRIQGGCGRGA